MPDITIRHATPNDAELLAQLGATTFFDAYADDLPHETLRAYVTTAYTVEVQTEELADSGNIFLIAEADAETAGFAMLRADDPPPEVDDPNTIELARIYVLQESIGQGIGAALMRACLHEAGERGASTMWLGVWEHNPRAIRFYEKWGFAKVGTQTFTLGGDPLIDLVMQRAVLLLP